VIGTGYVVLALKALGANGPAVEAATTSSGSVLKHVSYLAVSLYCIFVSLKFIGRDKRVA
jgi:hypothetical protein